MNSRRAGRIRRHRRIRKHVFGAGERPRMSVFRSHKHLYVQLIDDLSNQTVLSCSTQMDEVRGQLQSTGNVAAGEQLGRFVAAQAKKKGIERVVFDRAGYRYHGSIKALADAARSGGLAF
ncbi:MAG: 50S ribosomal protein L18 [Candidatus Omnitrophica bacterium]|nr:50S ribosomal protein L18 [Candidatus Omnitrophota bacterium]